MSTHVHIADRAALSDATDLIDRFGAFAGSEAAQRANHSRDQGNLVHFCRWRQIERAIEMLSRDRAPGAVH